MQTLKVDQWKPVNTQARISDPKSIIERLGGRQLYGDDPGVPIRELIQNAADAIHARRFIDPFFRPSPTRRFPGTILIEIKRRDIDEAFIISIEDNGIGMPERVITKCLLDFGTSFWSSDLASELYPGLPSELNFHPIGKFGIGFFSVFMFSDYVRVLSREFRSAKDSWNVLTFHDGVRVRGQFSVESNPTTITMPDASTRVEFLVKDDFIRNLVKLGIYYQYNDDVNYDDNQKVFNSFIRQLSLMVLPLDIPVSLRGPDGNSTELNNPLYYELDPTQAWNTLTGLVAVNRSLSQEKLFRPLKSSDGLLFYGYGGLNIGYGRTEKFVGGLGCRSRTYREDPIWGVVEYESVVASREPSLLTAPRGVVSKWLTDQIELVKTCEFTVGERARAANSLAKLSGDGRHLFIVKTNVGHKDFHQIIELMKIRRLAVIPISVYGTYSNKVYEADAPTHNGLRLRLEEIECDCLTLEFLLHEYIQTDIERNKYDKAFNAIINQLKDDGCVVECELRERTLGKYVGRGSEYHNLKDGDMISMNCIEIRVIDKS